jgi:hypothetical protein
MMHRIFAGLALAVLLGGLAGCFQTDAEPEKKTPIDSTPVAIDSTRFKIGLYEGKDTVYGVSIIEHFIYLRSDGTYELYEFIKLEDYDSMVCLRQTRGHFADSGDTIAFTDIEWRDRYIDSLKTAATPWDPWIKREDRSAPKSFFYSDYGYDHLDVLELGGDASGNYWSVNVRSDWIGPETQAIPLKKD